MEATILTFEMTVVLGLLALTVFLFVSEIIRIDLAAILVMVILGGLSTLPGLRNLADRAQLFSGFSSNAVISIIAVMIIGDLRRDHLHDLFWAWRKNQIRAQSMTVAVQNGPKFYQTAPNIC